MYYTIYKITNLTNNYMYVGYHATNNLEDDYAGSGKIIKHAIQKYGLENFKKEILYVFPSKQEALLKEREIVNENFIKREDTYNIKLGGEGGWDHTYNDPKTSNKRKEAIKESFKNGISNGWQLSKEQRIKIGKSAFKGKTHTKEARKKIGDAKLLNESIIDSRLNDYNAIEKKWGWKAKLAKQWEVSHTQVNRFINDYVK